jgi:exopolysaccharide biosynthesis WecB/TagA/CpsF family protein
MSTLRPVDRSQTFRALEVDDYDVDAFLAVVSAFPATGLGFAVTPNVDHFIRYCTDAEFRRLYDRATYRLLDSRFAASVQSLLFGSRLRVCPGSDLTAALFDSGTFCNERIVLIGGSTAQAAELSSRYHLSDLRHFNPPMGFISDPVAVAECLEYIEKQSPFRLCLLAVGSPQQEILAHQLSTRSTARGLALCVGASINFITGVEKRAPRWIQNLSLEWLYRLSRNPRRLLYRYLIRGPRFFLLLRRWRFVTRIQSPDPGEGRNASAH